MKVTFDSGENAGNVLKRRLSFNEVSKLEWASAVILEDRRKDYGERRFRVFGYIEKRLHAIVFTPRNDTLHIISFRKANRREIKLYG